MAAADCAVLLEWGNQLNLDTSQSDWCCNSEPYFQCTDERLLHIFLSDVNDFSSEIPTDIGDLTELQTFSLRHVGVSGIIPESFEVCIF